MPKATPRVTASQALTVLKGLAKNAELRGFQNVFAVPQPVRLAAKGTQRVPVQDAISILEAINPDSELRGFHLASAVLPTVSLAPTPAPASSTTGGAPADQIVDSNDVVSEEEELVTA